MMEPARIRAMMTPPDETGFRDGLAVLRAYHMNDAEGLATVLANCDPMSTLKAVISFYEVSLIIVGTDPCELLDHIEIDGGTEPGA